MGNRNLTIVYYKGEYRICQYGQWGGNPEGQGLVIYDFLLDPANITKLEQVLDAGDRLVHTLTEEEEEDFQEEMFEAEVAWNARPYNTSTWKPFQVPIASLSRDTGAKIPNLLVRAADEEPVRVRFWPLEFVTDTLFCEWAWVVDLDKKVLEAYSSWVYDLVEEKKVSRFAELFGDKRLPGLVKRYEFVKLPESKRAMLEDSNAGRRE